MSGVGVSGKCHMAWDCAGVMGVVLWWKRGRCEGGACGGWKKGRRGHALSGVAVGEGWGWGSGEGRSVVGVGCGGVGRGASNPR